MSNMKRIKKLPIICLFICLVAAVAFFAAFSAGGKTASANSDYDYDAPRPINQTYIEGYDVTMDVKANREIKVTEDITVYFYNNSGFIRDIPVNAGELVHNVKVREIKDGKQSPVLYNVSGSSDDSNNSFISVDIGDYSKKFDELHTYRLEYDYCLTKAQEGSDMLALTPIGAGWECNIYNIKIKLILPEGFILDDRTFCSTYGKFNNENSVAIHRGVAENGKQTLYTDNIPYIEARSQVRFDVHFEDGVLSTYFDFTPYICVIVGVILIIALAVIKLVFFNKHKIIPVVNFEAPDKMDPLIMGKLIDNYVDDSDITALIYYFADKGWLKINFEDKNSEPVLIRTVKCLPEGCADYERLTFDKLFTGNDTVTPRQLKYKFYKAIPNIRFQVNAKTKNLYSIKSKIASYIFALLGVLLIAIAPICLALAQISKIFIIITLLPLFFAAFPAFFVYLFSRLVKSNYLKYSIKKQVLCYSGIIALCAVLSVFYVFLVPSYIIPIPAKIALCVICSAQIICSVILVTRTESYVKQLNEIIGFKNFIKLAEKNQLEKMLEQDPQYYYHILPYAQVLGVSAIWEEKFKDITIEPPHWCVTSNIASFYVMNRMINNSFSSMKENMSSRPSSSGSSGFSGGGGFGGHSGGGHGGGGGRFR